ncbi:MAG: DegT/DnrJ/EryC1/StrS family aminotransferase [Cyanobacteria bacterium Co-bin13]|nr:DegT/DnrJ/EryC1/StrS family aminotransferase [Cyanobacteria bacterium Co-bin13]
MSAIPPIDLTQQFQSIQDEVGAAVMQVLASGQYINGPLVETFAKAFGEYVGTSECVVCNSGTDALYLALRALNIGPGDEVITSPFTFIATAEMISAAGATPVFVDIDLSSFNLDVQKLEQAITEKTRAIMPVHLFGQPTDMAAVMAIAERHQIAVIEDCAQATGARWGEQQVGSIGHVGAFSFFPTKNLGGCGDGGALTTNNPEIAESARIIREHGSRVRYYHEAVGINSRLDALQAVILQIKLRYLDEWNARRSAVAEEYERLLAPIPGVITPQPVTGGTPVWNQYTLRLEAAEADGAVRDRIRQHMQSQGVLPMVYYPLPLHQQPVYAHLGYGPGSLPASEQAARQVLSLPMFPELSLDQQAKVVYSLKEALVQALH